MISPDSILSLSGCPFLIDKYDGVHQERLMTYPDNLNKGMKTSTEAVNFFEKSNQDREDSLEFRNENPSHLLHLLNLGTRFHVEEENCDARIIKLQQPPANDATSLRLLLLISC